MGYTQPWYSVRGLAAPVGEDMGHLTCYLRDGDRAFLTYATTGRGNEVVNPSLGLLDMTPYSRREGSAPARAPWTPSAGGASTTDAPPGPGAGQPATDSGACSG